MRNLTEGNIYKTFLLFSFPLVLSGMLSQAYGTVDTVIAGQYLGDPGLAATGATGPLVSFLSAAFWGYGAGFALFVARLFGAGDFEKMRRAILTNFVVMAVTGTLLGVFAIGFRDVIFDFLMLNDPVLRENAARYFLIYMGGFGLIMLNANCVFCFNAIGVTAFPFYMSILSAFLNVGGNLLTVAVFGMGVEGLAVATVFAALVVDILYFIRYFAVFRELKIEKGKLFGTDVVLAGLPYSGPVTFQQLALYIATLTLSPMVNSIGLAAPAAYAVVNRVYDVNASIYQNSAKTLSNYTAQCMGAGRPEKVKKGIFAAFIQGFIYLTPVLLFCVFFPQLTASLFFKKDASPEAVQMAVTFIGSFLPFILFNMINNLFHNLYRGVKKMSLLLISTAVGSAVRIFVGLWLTPLYGMNGFYIAWAVSWIAECLLCAAVFVSRLWVPKEVKDVM